LLFPGPLRWYVDVFDTKDDYKRISTLYLEECRDNFVIVKHGFHLIGNVLLITPTNGGTMYVFDNKSYNLIKVIRDLPPFDKLEYNKSHQLAVAMASYSNILNLYTNFEKGISDVNASPLDNKVSLSSYISPQEATWGSIWHLESKFVCKDDGLAYIVILQNYSLTVVLVDSNKNQVLKSGQISLLQTLGLLERETDEEDFDLKNTTGDDVHLTFTKRETEEFVYNVNLPPAGTPVSDIKITGNMLTLMDTIVRKIAHPHEPMKKEIKGQIFNIYEISGTFKFDILLLPDQLYFAYYFHHFIDSVIIRSI